MRVDRTRRWSAVVGLAGRGGVGVVGCGAAARTSCRSCRAATSAPPRSDGRTGRRSSVEQAENAALITAIVDRAAGCRRGRRRSRWRRRTRSPTCYNIDYGDRDSLGLFQQRPSQGWGTAERGPGPGLRHQRVLRRAGRRRRLRVAGDHRGRPGGAALGLPRRLRRPRGRRPRARLRADRQLARTRSPATSTATPTPARRRR